MADWHVDAMVCEGLNGYVRGLRPLEKRMKSSVTIDRDEAGAWVVECPSIPGCVSQGAPKQDALRKIEDAIRGCLETRAELGLPLTVEVGQVEVTV